MAQPILFMNHRNGNQEVYRVAGASPQQLGTDLNANAETATTPNNFLATNRVIQFQGEVYAAGADGVYRFNQGPGNFPSGTVPGDWSNNPLDGGLTFGNPETGVTGEVWKSGIFQVVIGNVPMLCGAYNTSTSTTNWRGYMLNGNTGVWSETADTVLANFTANATNPYATCFMYRNVLYWVGFSGSVTQTLTFDPGSGSLGAFITNGLAGANPAGTDASICIFNDRLFMLGRTASPTIYLYEFTGGNWADVFQITGGSVSGNAEMKTCLFLNEDGSKMIAFWRDQGGTAGWRAIEIEDIAGTITEGSEITSAVIPSGIRHNGSGAPANSRFTVFYDQETTPGSYRVLLYYAPDGDSASVLTQYVWTNNATLLTAEDTGGSCAWAPGENIGPAGGGERIFTQGELHIEIVERLAVLGGEEVRFKCWGDVGAVDKKVEFKFDAENEVPIATATLIGTPSVVSGPGAAPTRNVNVLEGVEADDGATIYAVTWDISTDGFVSGQRGQLVPRIFI